MTPKEKANDLVYQYRIILMREDTECGNEILCSRIAKHFALIAVDEIINSEPRKPSNVDWDEVGATHQYYYEAQIEEAQKFWQEVKQEIEKL
jgi:hypothetical protein